MRSRPLVALVLSGALVLPACVTTTTTSSQWGGPPGEAWARDGRVESIRETVRRQQGDPAAGAAAGAIIGGLLGGALGGHYGRWGYYHPSAAGTLFGAAGGAMVGAAASQSSEERFYEVFVRFDDGATQSFVYAGYPPFAVGEAVRLTPQGLGRR
jgi:outer membrane lipoprotein SlyB